MSYAKPTFGRSLWAWICIATALFSSVAASSAHATPAPAVALHYGASLPVQDLRTFDIVVVEPGHGGQATAALRSAGPRVFAYASVAEVQPTRPDYPQIPAAWKMARNGDWKSDVIDQTPPEWPDFFADQVIAPLWKQGYRGFFLDTLDSYRLAQSFDEAAQQQGLVRVIETLHRRFAGIELILNRGFEIVPRVKDKIHMVAAESLYQRWNARTQRYETVSDADRQWLTQQLRTVQTEHRLPALVIDYVAPHDRALTRATAARIQADGFIPWVTDAALHSVGIGSIEAMPRRVLVAYNGAEAPSLNYTAAHRFLQMPLNHLGYVVEFADINAGPLPAVMTDRYAGIVTWFTGFVPEDKSVALQRWLQARMAEKMPVLVLDSFGFALPPALAAQWGIQAADVAAGPQKIIRKNAMLGFEVDPEPLAGTRLRWSIPGGATPNNAQALIELQDARGNTHMGGAITPWGGFMLAPFVTQEVPGGDYARWVVDPFALLTQALRLPAMPVPDTTTENGRRLVFSHVDGDGFASRAELAGSPLAADVMRREIVEKYRHIPHAVSVIEAETAPHGLYPSLSPQLEDIARKLFRLPQVEIASHTYSHPFLWDEKVRHGVFGDKSEAAHGLQVPGYTMNLEREIVGSTQYINQRLAPADKKVQILLWSGDTAPNAEALAITEKAGLLNMNGGDTSINQNVPTLTEVGPLGIQKEGHLQVYAPITNENIYTNLWKGPFYGYERVLQTFAMTESPRRLKPVDIYYHTYSASKRAGLAALHKVYGWAQSQPLHPVFPSDYIRKVRDWHSFGVAREGHGWRVRGDGHVRTLRLPTALGVPNMAQSQGVAGWRAAPQNDIYVHLSGPTAHVETRADATAAPAQPMLQEANARISRWMNAPERGTLQFTLTGHAPLEFTLAQAQDCQVRAAQQTLKALPSTQTYRLPHAAADIQIQCQRR